MDKLKSIKLLLLGNACLLIAIAFRGWHDPLVLPFLLLGAFFAVLGFFLPAGEGTEEDRASKKETGDR